MADLTVTITEAVTLSGSDRGTTNTKTVAITEVDHRILDVGTSEITILQIAASAAAGTFVVDTLKHLRITNLHSSNTITLRIGFGDGEYFVQLEGSSSYILSNNEIDAFATTGNTVNLENITNIRAKASSASQLEYFIGLA